MNNNFNIPQLTQKFFGLTGANQADFMGGTFLNKPKEVSRSVFGVPIYENFTLSLKENGADVVNYTFPGWPLMELNCPNRIIKTEVTYQSGTVKEFIGEGDYEITLRGFLINHTENAIPLRQMKELKDVCKTGRTLKITSEVLNGLGIHYIVVENLVFHEVEAAIVAQPFTLTLCSDYPYELVIQESRILKKQGALKALNLLLNK